LRSGPVFTNSTAGRAPILQTAAGADDFGKSFNLRIGSFCLPIDHSSPTTKPTSIDDLAAPGARGLRIVCPQGKEGAGKAGCPRHPQSCARMHMTDRRCAGTPGLPCAVVLTAYGVLSPETNSSCLRRRRIDDVLIRLDQTHLRRLDTSHGCRDHTLLPSAASFARRPDRAHVLPAEISREGV